jgi:dienelactone hydrolase
LLSKPSRSFLREGFLEDAVLSQILEEPVLASHQTQEDLTAYLLARIPPFRLPDPATWEAEAQRLRQRVLEEVIFRGAPEAWRAGAVNAVWGDVIETDRAYRIRKLRYEALPGLWIPAVLYEPDTLDGQVPAILNVNGHVGPPGKAIEYKQIRCINLAKRGMLALNPEWFFFGELQGNGYHHNRAGYLDLCGVAGVGVFFLAMQRGLEVLLAHPHTDPDRLAVTGLSGGGWQTIILSALDTRVRLAAPNAGYIGLDVRVKHREDIGDIEQNPADLATIADYPMLTALLAPRPALLLYNEKDDCCFQTERARPSVYEPVKPLYEALGRPDAFEFHNNLEPGTHNYDLDNRQQFYRFLNRHFLKAEERVDDEIPSQDEVRTGEELTAGVPEHNANFVTLAAERAGALPRSSWPHGDPSAVRAWQEAEKTRLRAVLRYTPLKVNNHLPGEEQETGDFRIQRFSLRLEGGWNLPVIQVRGPQSGDEVFLVTADEGRASAAPLVESLARQGKRVYVADLLFHGECRPAPTPASQWAMMVSAAGERALGIQAAQLAAVIAWAGKPGEAVSLAGLGRVASVITLLAAVLAGRPVRHVALHDSLSSLACLIDRQVRYEDAPSLFCFGLLEAFDIRELIGLLAPVPVEVFCVEGDDGKALLRLRELYARFGRMGFTTASGRSS